LSAGPVVVAFRLVDNAIQVDLAGRLCCEHLPAASREVFRLTLINLLKTANAEKFAGCDDADSAAPPPPIEVGTLVVTWSEWVAAWAGEREAQGTPNWDLIPVR
jgi:hypothetical protein